MLALIANAKERKCPVEYKNKYILIYLSQKKKKKRFNQCPSPHPAQRNVGLSTSRMEVYYCMGNYIVLISFANICSPLVALAGGGASINTL